jgi:hypothetical protein
VEREIRENKEVRSRSGRNCRRSRRRRSEVVGDERRSVEWWLRL